MDRKKKHIVLIGMPGAGKSTLGVVLAKAIGYNFLDSDLVIQEKEGKILSDIIKEEGISGFNNVENNVNRNINPAKPTVIATGGSAVYGKEAMEHFKKIAQVIYIKLNMKTILKRVGNVEKRGISIEKGMTLEDLYRERMPLYEKYADITLDANNLSILESIETLKTKII